MLTELDAKILKFEADWSGVRGNREAAIRNTFGLSAAGYFQQLYRVLDSSEALETEPMLVKRLNRVRRARIENRGIPFTDSMAMDRSKFGR